MQILIIEDDKRISDFLVKGLEEAGFLVTLCRNAEEALADFLDIDWGLIIVDVMLPGIDGVQLVQTLRYKKVYAPILVLSALNAVVDKVMALDSGADDYMVKPFHFDELLSRIKALTRRNQYQQMDTPSTVKTFGELQIDSGQYKVYLKKTEIELSPREFKLLKYLSDNSERAVSRVQILNSVWGISFDSQTNVVDVYISYLRNKIEGQFKFIYTIKGVGYMFKVEDDEIKA